MLSSSCIFRGIEVESIYRGLRYFLSNLTRASLLHLFVSLNKYQTFYITNLYLRGKRFLSQHTEPTGYRYLRSATIGDFDCVYRSDSGRCSQLLCKARSKMRISSRTYRCSCIPLEISPVSYLSHLQSCQAWTRLLVEPASDIAPSIPGRTAFRRVAHICSSGPIPHRKAETGPWLLHLSESIDS